jgi:uncharacterized protein DUF4013
MKGTIDYRRALRYQLDDPQWGMTLLFNTLALLVPIIGPIVGLGYQSTVIEALARGGVGAPPPRFDFDRLADYLIRGLRMFVVALLSLAVLPIAFVLVFAGNFTAAILFSRNSPVASVIGCVAVGVEVVLFVTLIVGMMALLAPLLVRAALATDFGAGFDVAFWRDFMARVGRDVVVSHLAHIGISLAFFVAGVLACGIGVFPAATYATLVHAHLLGQLYLLYVQRGGRAVALPQEGQRSPN